MAIQISSVEFKVSSRLKDNISIFEMFKKDSESVLREKIFVFFETKRKKVIICAIFLRYCVERNTRFS